MRPSRPKNSRYFFAVHAAIFLFSLSLSLSLCLHRFLHQKRRLVVDFQATRKESSIFRLFIFFLRDRSCNKTSENKWNLREFPMIPYESIALCCIALPRSIYIYIYRRCVSPISSFSGIVPRTVGWAIEIDAFFPSTNSLVRLNRRLMEIDLMVNAFSAGPSVFKQRDGKSIA